MSARGYHLSMNKVVRHSGEVGASHPIASVDNALRVIMMLAEQPSVRVLDVAETLGVARSTAHRVLTALLARGFVVQDARKIYHRGPFFDIIAERAAPRLDIRAHLHPHLVALSERLGETVHLGVLEGNGARFIDGVPSTRTLRVGVRTGMLLPAHRTSIGKALLAELPAESLRALYPRGLDGTAGTSIQDRHAFERQIAAVRRTGYARNDGESDARVAAVAMCVRDDSGLAVAAVAIALPRVRFDRSMVPDLIAELDRTLTDARAVAA